MAALEEALDAFDPAPRVDGAGPDLALSPRATLEALIVGVIPDDESAAVLADYDRIIALEDW